MTKLIFSQSMRAFLSCRERRKGSCGGYFVYFQSLSLLESEMELSGLASPTYQGLSLCIDPASIVAETQEELRIHARHGLRTGPSLDSPKSGISQPSASYHIGGGPVVLASAL